MLSSWTRAVASCGWDEQVPFRPHQSNERGLSCAPDALIVYNSMETFSLSADLEMHFTGAATVLLLQLTALPLVVAGSTMLPQSRIIELRWKRSARSSTNTRYWIPSIASWLLTGIRRPGIGQLTPQPTLGGLIVKFPETWEPDLGSKEIAPCASSGFQRDDRIWIFQVGESVKPAAFYLPTTSCVKSALSESTPRGNSPGLLD